MQAPLVPSVLLYFEGVFCYKRHCTTTYLLCEVWHPSLWTKINLNVFCAAFRLQCNGLGGQDTKYTRALQRLADWGDGEGQSDGGRALIHDGNHMLGRLADPQRTKLNQLLFWICHFDLK